MPFKKIHRFTAVILSVFIVSHLGIHLTALISKEAHLQSLDIVQVVYRNPIGEVLLVLAILTQIFTGLKRLRIKRNSKDRWARIQVWTGLYLIFFLLNHTGAALFTHHIMNVETDFYWAAGSLMLSPIKYGFAIYYFLAVLSVFIHFSAALHFGWKGTSPRLEKTISVSGAIVGGLIIFGFGGLLYEIIIPENTMAYFEKMFGVFNLTY